MFAVGVVDRGFDTRFLSPTIYPFPSAKETWRGGATDDDPCPRKSLPLDAEIRREKKRPVSAKTMQTFSSKARGVVFQIN
jgi:hypothetical protein